MSNLISGFLGAILATILTILYLYYSEKKRRCHDVYLAVLKYLDDIYIRIMKLYGAHDSRHNLSSKLDQKTIDSLSGFDESDIFNLNTEITELLLSHSIRGKVAIVYGEGRLLQNLSELFKLFNHVHDMLRSTKQSEWLDEKDDEIFNFIDEKIDPCRIQLQNDFRKESSIRSITNMLFADFKSNFK